MAHFLGLDLGTSGLKGVLVNDRGQVIASHLCEYPLHHPQPLWSEQHPEDWWQACLQVAQALRQQAPQAWQDVVALGLSGQMHGAVLVDQHQQPLRPAILWNDGRAHQQCQLLRQRCPALGQLAGVQAMPGFTAPKLLWVAEHEPELFARLRWVMLPKDYLRLRLTGEVVTDCSDAAGSLWLDQQQRQWSPALVEASGIQLQQLPRLVEGDAISAQLSHQAAQALQLRPGLIVAGGGGDAATGALALGAFNPGQGFITLGTSSQYWIATEGYRPQPESLLHAFAHALPGRWYQMACLLNGASPLLWFAQICGQSPGQLLAEAEAAYQPANDVLFLPYLRGERTPHNNPFARASFHGMDGRSQRPQLTQAILEGICFSLAQCQQLLAQAGAELEQVGALGGGARNRFWLQLLANVLNKPVLQYEDSQSGPALGAARLAMLAWQPADPAHYCPPPPVLACLQPDPALHAQYQPRYHRFLQLYQDYEAPRSQQWL